MEALLARSVAHQERGSEPPRVLEPPREGAPVDAGAPRWRSRANTRARAGPPRRPCRDRRLHARQCSSPPVLRRGRAARLRAARHEPLDLRPAGRLASSAREPAGRLARAAPRRADRLSLAAHAPARFGLRRGWQYRPIASRSQVPCSPPAACTRSCSQPRSHPLVLLSALIQHHASDSRAVAPWAALT